MADVSASNTVVDFDFVLSANTLATVASNYETYTAMPFFKHWEISSNGAITNYPNNSVVASMTSMKVLGKTRPEYMGSDRVSALTSTLPNEEYFWHVAVKPDVSVTGTIFVTLIIDYYIEFFGKLWIDEIAVLKRQWAMLQKAAATNGTERKLAGHLEWWSGIAESAEAAEHLYGSMDSKFDEDLDMVESKSEIGRVATPDRLGPAKGPPAGAFWPAGADAPIQSRRVIARGENLQKSLDLGGRKL